MKRITFFTRERCHLCDEALEVLARVRKSTPFALDIVDLDKEAPAEKRALYDWDVPVVELEGRKIMKHRIDETRLLRLLNEASS